ncbi:MAG: hypothetical protein J6S67_22120 [Methanobrevibacter sp.]|nr:hypothetical protein [Methanobrevibacter sp.]
MKNKSYVTAGPLELNESMRYGQILAESYFTTTRTGVYKESTPNTSEILNQWFWPLVDCFEMRGGYVYIKEWNTGLFIERYTGPDEISTERIIFKPTPDTSNESAALEALNGVFKDRYLKNAND